MTRKIQAALFCLLFILQLILHSSVAMAQPPSIKRYYHKNQASRQSMSAELTDLSEINNRQVLIKLNSLDKDISRMNDLGLEPIETPSPMRNRNILLYRIPESMDFISTINELKSHKAVQYAEPDYLTAPSFLPNDPFYSKQWFYQTLNMEAAWEIHRGSPGTVIAVLDTGVNHNHPDLQGRLLIYL